MLLDASFFALASLLADINEDELLVELEGPTSDVAPFSASLSPAILAAARRLSAILL